MKPPIISRHVWEHVRARVRERVHRQMPAHRRDERGVTMALVAAAMVAIMAMAALSIDAVTLYLANAEAQRSADSAALAAARVISLSGITGTASTGTQGPYWQQICGGSSSLATQTAQAVATQNTVGGATGTVTTTYSVGAGAPNSDCSTLSAGFAVNPLVTVKVQRTLPTFFARIWGKTGSSVSATAAAEGYNPSGSATYVASGIIPVQPRCVKPWVIPNLDPLNPPPNKGVYCNPNNPTNPLCRPITNLTDGSIIHPGISLGGSGANGVIGETFWLVLDCNHNNPASCTLRGATTQPTANYSSGASSVKPPPNVLYAPGQVGTTVTAIPSCTQGDAYEEAIEGCDAPTNYQCGAQLANAVELSRNPDTSGATTNGVQCLTAQGNGSGQDTIDTGSYPFQIQAGDQNPLVTTGLLSHGKTITSSNSIVSLPIYDNAVNITSGATKAVTFVGFLQVFINSVDQYGNVNVTVLNVAGCGNGNNPTGNPVSGSSPVPVRLITQP
jgi:Flp pilus assembly protein TadG